MRRLNYHYFHPSWYSKNFHLFLISLRLKAVAVVLLLLLLELGILLMYLCLALRIPVLFFFWWSLDHDDQLGMIVDSTGSTTVCSLLVENCCVPRHKRRQHCIVLQNCSRIYFNIRPPCHHP